MTPLILDVMPEGTYRRMMTPELEAELATLGTIVACRNAQSLSEEEYGDLWERADAVLSGWGVRPPTAAILDRAARLKVISHTAGSVRMFPRYALEKGVVITTARAAIARSVGEFCLMNTLVLLRRQLFYVDSNPARKAFLSPDGGKPYSQTLFDKPDHPLRALPNVLFTPHIAGPAEDDLPYLTRTALTDLARVLRGEPPIYPITPEAYDIMSF